MNENQVVKVRNLLLFPWIWLIYPGLLGIVVLLSFLAGRSGNLGKPAIGRVIVVMGAGCGFFFFLLPFFEQVTCINIILNYGLGVPIFVFGIVSRVYPMLYLRKKNTTTTVTSVSARVVQTGPYGIVRHPQYTGGIILILGWTLIWGAMYCLLLSPLLIALIATQARIEERYILEKQFGEEYRVYKQQVGMLFPKIRGRGSSKAPASGIKRS